MPATVQFFDMSVNSTPPGGHLQPTPIIPGPNGQPNDVRMAFIAAAGASSDITLSLPLFSDPPTGYTSSFSLDPGHETFGAYYRRLVGGDASPNIALYKPAQWRYYLLGLLTARGVSPTVNPTAGRLSVSNITGASTATIASVTVPSAGVMVFFLATVPDPENGWPSWAVSMGAPTGWTNLVASDQSGAQFYAYGTNPAVMVIAQRFSSAGSTGAVALPVALGVPDFLGMYMFLTPAADVSVTIGSA